MESTESNPRTNMPDKVHKLLVSTLKYCPLCPPSPHESTDDRNELPKYCQSSLCKLLITKNIKDQSHLKMIIENSQYCSKCTKKIEIVHKMMDLMEDYKTEFNENWTKHLIRCFGPEYSNGSTDFQVKEEKLEEEPSAFTQPIPQNNSSKQSRPRPRACEDPLLFHPPDKRTKSKAGSNNESSSPGTPTFTSTTQDKHQHHTEVSSDSRPPSPTDSTVTCQVDNPSDDFYDYASTRSPSPTNSTHTILVGTGSSTSLNHQQTTPKSHHKSSSTSSSTKHKENSGASSEKSNLSCSAHSSKANKIRETVTNSQPEIRLERINLSNELKRKETTQECPLPKRPRNSSASPSSKSNHSDSNEVFTVTSDSESEEESESEDDDDTDSSDSEPNVENHSKSKRPFSFNCTKCPKSFQTESTFRRHRKYHESREVRKAEKLEKSKEKSPNKTATPSKPLSKTQTPNRTVAVHSTTDSESSSSSSSDSSSNFESDKSDSANSLRTVVIKTKPKRRNRKERPPKTPSDFIL